MPIIHFGMAVQEVNGRRLEGLAYIKMAGKGPRIRAVDWEPADESVKTYSHEELLDFSASIANLQDLNEYRRLLRGFTIEFPPQAIQSGILLA